jgi:multimeric flavodoxin WrbA
MKVIAFNGSPRKEKWNTVTLLNNALEGAASMGANTEMVHLYNLKFSGCISCFACKKTDRNQDGICALKDDLTPVLDRVRDADALLIGTPVYYHAESAATRAFLERLFFPYNKYSKAFESLFPKKIKTGLIYTMNITEEMANDSGYDKHFVMTKWALETTFGECEVILCTDTLQYDDYDKYESEAFDGKAKLKRHKEIFPNDCKRVFDLGVRLAS